MPFSDDVGIGIYDNFQIFNKYIILGICHKYKTPMVINLFHKLLREKDMLQQH